MKLRLNFRYGAWLPGLLAGTATAQLAGAQTESPSQSQDQEEIVVVSSRIPTSIREVGTAISVVTQDEIELGGFASIADVLRSQPGVAVTSTGGTGKVTTVRIRGEESFRTMVLLDGIEISDPTGTQVAPDFSHLLTTRDLERIEILRGPQGFLYGADAGGVVNIVSRRGAGDFSGDVGLELGEHGAQTLEGSLSGGGESADYFLSFAESSADGFNSRSTDVVLGDDDGFDNTTVHAKLGWNVNADTRVEFVVRDVDGTTEFDQCGFPTTHQCIAATDQTVFRASGEFKTGPVTHLLAYGESDIARSNLADGLLAFATEGDQSHIEYTGSFRGSEVLGVVFGFDFEDEYVLTSGGERFDRQQNAIYAEYQGQFHGNFFVTAGARQDDNDAFGQHTSIRTTGAYLQDLARGGALKYRVGFGTGFRAPSLFELSYNSGAFSFPPASTVTLTEETSSGFDIGIEYISNKDVSIGITYFDQEIEDEVFFDLSGFSGYLQSHGSTDSVGIELTLSAPLTERWRLTGNATINDTATADGLQRIRRPERLVNVGVRYGSADDRLQVMANIRNSSDAVDEVFGLGRIALDDYTVLDVSAAYRIGERLQAFGRIENATNTNYEEVIGFRTGGAMASFGLRVSF